MKHFSDALFEGITNDDLWTLTEETDVPKCEYCGTKLATSHSVCTKCGGQSKDADKSCKCNDCNKLYSITDIIKENGKLQCKSCGSNDFTLPKDSKAQTVRCEFCDTVYLKDKTKGKCAECGGALK